MRRLPGILLRAGRNWGWVLAILLAGFAIAYVGVNPVQQAADHVAAPVARSVGVLASRCPSGWDDLSDRGDHVQVFICAQDKWRVILKPDGKSFDHAVQLDTPGAEIIYDPSMVPNWL